MATDRRSGRPDGRRARWQAHREARRSELIEAAIRAVRKHGATAGMDDIAAEAGTSKPVIYRYFADKADLYLAVGSRVADWLVAEVTATLHSQPDPQAVLRSGIEAYLRIIESEPELYRFVVHRPLLDRPVPQDPVADYSTLISTHVTRLLGDMMRDAGLDSGAAEPWGFGLVGMVRSAGDWWLERRLMSREALVDYLTGLLWTGLAGAYAAAGIDVDSHPPVRLLRPTGTGDDA